MGHVRKQASRQVLQSDPCGRETLAEGDGKLEPRGHRHEHGAPSHAGGSMNILRWARSFRNSFFRRAQVDQEMNDELAFHLETRARDLEQSGLTPEEAIRTARLEFGAV